MSGWRRCRLVARINVPHSLGAGASRIRWEFRIDGAVAWAEGNLVYYCLARQWDVGWLSPPVPSAEFLISQLPESERAFALASSISPIDLPNERIAIDGPWVTL